MLPDFIGIGPARSATTWIYECLRNHPQICMAKWDKKTHFFDLYYDKGLKWYETWFSHCSAELTKGELTETYFFYDKVPELIHKHCPNIKIVTCLRNPIDRAFSAYLHLIRDGAFTYSFEKAITQNEKIFITDNLYYDHLKLYFELFPKEHIHVSLFEDVKNDPVDFLQNIYSFIEVDNQFLPSNYDRKSNVTEQPRFPLLNKIMLHSHFLLRNVDLYKYIVPIKDSKIIQRLRFKDREGASINIAPETRKKLQCIFDPQIEKLAELIGRDLSHWSE